MSWKSVLMSVLHSIEHPTVLAKGPFHCVTSRQQKGSLVSFQDGLTSSRM